VSEKQLQITSVRKYGEKRLVSFNHCFPSIFPGQFLLAYCPEKDNRIRDIYYALDLDNGYFSIPASLNWDIGDKLIFKGPIGKGFSKLDIYENILCINLSAEIAGLSGLMQVSVKTNKNIAFYGKHQPVLMDQSIEIIVQDMLIDTTQWADFIAIETNIEDLFSNQNFIEKIKLAGIPVEVIIHSPILCSGEANCMVCSIKTKKGWVKTCQSGSVFNLNELEIT